MNKVVVTYVDGPIWKVHTQKKLRGQIHTWMPEVQRMLLLKELELNDQYEVSIFPGEFLSYLNQYGMLVPIMRA